MIIYVYLWKLMNYYGKFRFINRNLIDQKKIENIIDIYKKENKQNFFQNKDERIKLRGYTKLRFLNVYIIQLGGNLKYILNILV